MDVRHSWDWDDVSLSVGLGLETPISFNSWASTLPNLDLSSVHGYGADVPVLVGWQSAARIYMVWAGLRGGWDHTTVSAQTTAPGSATSTDPVHLDADRFYGGGVAGLAAGFRHVHAALELDAAYQTIHGTFAQTSATVSGFSVAPAAALWFDF
jgi:hypothetical protein